MGSKGILSIKSNTPWQLEVKYVFHRQILTLEDIWALTI